MTTETIYDRLAGSPYNGAVGGGDPADVSRRQAQIIHQLAPFRTARTVLDFGCGIGRTMPALHELQATDGFVLDGCDISQEFIDESRRIHASLPFRFYRIPGTNEHYDRYDTSKTAASALPASDFYDAGYSFSVLTHVNLAGASSIFEDIKKYVRTGGHYYFTLFRLDRQSKKVINDNASPAFRFRNRVAPDTKTFYAADKDKYAFTALDHEELEDSIYRQGLAVVQYMPGAWRGYPADNLHDAYLLRKL